MPREYGKVWFSLFTDEDFVSQPRFDKLLYVALIGQPSLNSAGLLPINLKRWRKACRDGDHLPTELEIKAALIRMERRRYVFCDDDTGEALVRSFIRSDKVDKQPNVLINAFRCAAQVESPKLAAALQEELTRITIPEVNGIGKQAAKLREQLPIVHAGAVTHLDTLTTGRGPFPEPFSEDFPGGSGEPSIGPSTEPSEIRGSGRGSREGFDRPPVVVEVEVVQSPTADGYVTKKRENGENFLGTPHEPSTPPPPDPQSEPEPPADKRAWSKPAAALVREMVGTKHPPAVLTALRLRSSSMLTAGISADDIRGGLEIWMAKPHLGPNLLDSLVSEHQRKAAPSAGLTGTSKADIWTTSVINPAEEASTQRRALE